MSSTAGRVGTTAATVCITHPFHPLAGRRFELVSRGVNWGHDRVVCQEPDGTLHTFAAALTDIDPPDAFQRVADGRAAFGFTDLLDLRAALDQLAARWESGDA
jgi:hypothetical protein